MALIKASSLDPVRAHSHFATGFVAWRFDDKTREFYLFESPDACWSHLCTLEPSKRNYYETIVESRRQKPRFDLDMASESLPPGLTWELVLDDVLVAIMSALCVLGFSGVKYEDCVYVYTSNGTTPGGGTKYSAHIVVMGYYHNTNDEARRFYDLVRESCHPRVRGFVDSAVYKSVQQFRMYGNTKAGQARHKTRLYRLDSGKAEYVWSREGRDDRLEYLDSLVTRIDEGATYIPLARPERASVECQVVEDRMADILALIPPGFTLGRYNVWGYHLVRVSQTKCPICERVHDNENAYVVVYDDIVYFKCFRDDKRTRWMLGALESDDGSAATSEPTKQGSEKPKRRYPLMEMLESVKEPQVDDASEINRPLIFKRWSELASDELMS